jgi:archaellin
MFNLNSVTTAIKTATLTVKISAGSLPLNLDVAIVTSDAWAENTINWNNKPTYSTIVGHIGNDGNAVLNVDGLNSVLGDKMLTLCLVDSLSQDALMTFGSREGGVSVSPILKITL